MQTLIYLLVSSLLSPQNTQRLHGAQLQNTISLDFLSPAQVWIAMRMHTTTSSELMEFSLLSLVMSTPKLQKTTFPIPLAKANRQLGSSKEDLGWLEGERWLRNHRQRCSLVSMGGLKTKLKLVALTYILAMAGSSVGESGEMTHCSELCFSQFLRTWHGLNLFSSHNSNMNDI